jgi:signal transduction histidine kinase
MFFSRSGATVHGVRLRRSGESEVLAGIFMTSSTPPLVQGQANAERAITEPGNLAAISTGAAGTAGSSGVLATREEELRWVRVPIDLRDTVDGYFVAGYLVTRLLHWAAAQIGEDDLTRRIPVRHNDAIAALADQLNAMMERLRAAFATQRQFFDDASHELRTPITIIRGNLELLGDDPTERAEDIRLCLDELDRMSRIVDDLLLLAKSERPDFVRPEPVDLTELTSDLDAKVRALGERHWQLEAIGEGTVRVDPQRITQAMVQLAHNAVQHTKSGDVITNPSGCSPCPDTAPPSE